MSHAFEEECAYAGLDAHAVEKIARRLARAARDADRLGLVVFGGSSGGSLRWRSPDDPLEGRALIVANVGGPNWDGGDGGYSLGDDGLNRGE